MMDGFYSYNYGLGHMLGFGWVFMLIFWALVIWAIVAFIRSMGYGHHCRHCQNKEHHHGSHGHHHGHHGSDEKAELESGDRALAILKERYAKGDISKEEFQEKKEELLK
jgi:putative membrane protein